MNNNMPLRALAVGFSALLLGWWLWPTAERLPRADHGTLPSDAVTAGNDSPYAAAIRPISEAGATAAIPALSPDTARSISPAAISRFERALDLTAEGDTAGAEALYQQLIQDYPRMVEAYVNLAAVYAGDGRLDQARQRLTEGLNANEDYAVLYASLQKVLGALAANAYREALVENTETRLNLDLPVMPSLRSEGAQIASLQAELKKNQADLETGNFAVNNTARLLAELQAMQQELAAANQHIAELEARYSNELEALRVQLAARSGAGEQPQAVAIDTQISEAVAATAAAPDDGQQIKQQDAQAVRLVKAWADAWTRQAIDDYVASYADDYRPPGSDLTRAQWLEQHRARFTNKRFIEVAVSDFSVSRAEDSFAVTFSQHYRSNTIDDRFRKRLVFASSGSDWSDAKIIDEKVVSP